MNAFHSHLFSRWLQSLTMEVILSTAFGVKAETQTVENDPITELAKKAMAPHPLTGLFCKDLLLVLSLDNPPLGLITLHLTCSQNLKNTP